METFTPVLPKGRVGTFPGAIRFLTFGLRRGQGETRPGNQERPRSQRALLSSENHGVTSLFQWACVMLLMLFDMNSCEAHSPAGRNGNLSG